MKQSLMNFRPVLVGAALLACGGDSTSPSQRTGVGSYSAVEFVTTGTSGQTNRLLLGSTLQINLAADGRTTGHLHIAASGGNPAFDADLAGTWSQKGDIVDFTQVADSFVRDMVFTMQPIAVGVWDLVGDQALSGTRFQVTLRRAP